MSDCKTAQLFLIRNRPVTWQFHYSDFISSALYCLILKRLLLIMRPRFFLATKIICRFFVSLLMPLAQFIIYNVQQETFLISCVINLLL